MDRSIEEGPYTRFFKDYSQCGDATKEACMRARIWHRGQKLNGSNRDVMDHVLKTALMAASLGYPEETVVTALLHEALEKGIKPDCSPVTVEDLKESGLKPVEMKGIIALTVTKEPVPSDIGYSRRRHRKWLKHYFAASNSSPNPKAVRQLDQHDRYVHSNVKKYEDRAAMFSPRPSPEEIRDFIESYSDRAPLFRRLGERLMYGFKFDIEKR